MSEKVDSLKIDIVSNEEIEKLERIKLLLSEIKSLKEEIFGKQEVSNEKIGGTYN